MSQEEQKTHWQDLLTRLAKVSSALEAGHGQSAAQTRQILDARAKEMAVASERNRDADPTIEVVTFQLTGQRCGVATRFVFEVLPLPICSPLPGTPPYFLGVCSLRGQILLVADLSRLLGFPASPVAPAGSVGPNGGGAGAAADAAQLLVLGLSRPEVGILSLGTCQTTAVKESAVKSSTELHALPRGNWVRGLTPDGLLLLDGQTLLGDPSLFVNQLGEER